MNNRKKLENKLDKMWPIAVKERAEYKCEKCGRESGKLDAHHIFGRGRKSTRWNLDNGLALCFTCHRLGAHAESYDTQQEFHKWLLSHKGQESLDILEKKSNMLQKRSMDELEALILELENSVT